LIQVSFLYFRNGDMSIESAQTLLVGRIKNGADAHEGSAPLAAYFH
jgi:hypothetical protein